MLDYKNEIEGLGTTETVAESKENAEDVVVEQRPSTKYGRTAYQQQLQAEREAASQMDQEQTEDAQTWQNGYQQNGYQQNPYQQNAYQQNQYQNYSAYQGENIGIRSGYASALMGLIGIRAIISFVLTYIMLGAYDAVSYIATEDPMAVIDMEALMDAIMAISVEPVYSVLSSVHSILFWAMMVFFVLDLMQLYRANIKIVGAVLFSIFLKPAYFIWRAHLLKQKKTLPIIFAVSVCMMFVLEIAVAFMGAFEMVMRSMY